MRHIPESSIGVLVADDSTIICKLIVQLLQREKSMHIVGVAGTLGDTLHLAAEYRPDILLLDLHLDNMSLRDATRVKIALLSCVRRVICMSTKSDAEEFELAQNYGAACLVDKFWLSEQLLGSILACTGIKREQRLPAEPQARGISGNASYAATVRLPGEPKPEHRRRHWPL